MTGSAKSATWTLVDSLAILFEKKRIVLPEPRIWPEAIDELEAFEFAVSDSGNVKTGAPSGQHDDCVVALTLAAWLVRGKPHDRELAYTPSRAVTADLRARSGWEPRGWSDPRTLRFL